MNKIKTEKRLQPFHEESNIGTIWKIRNVLLNSNDFLIYLGFKIETRNHWIKSRVLGDKKITEEIKIYDFFSLKEKKNISYTHHQMFNIIRFSKIS